MDSTEDLSILQPQEAKLFRESINQIFQNDFRLDRIVSDIRKVETTFEFKFSRDLIRFILHEDMTDLQWIPTGMFAHHDLDSPFTPQARDAVKENLNSHKHQFHQIYRHHFPDKSKVVEKHTENCNLFVNYFISETFSPEHFITWCTFLGVFAGLSYLYGSHFAPYQTFLAIIRSVKIIKCLKKVDDEFWNEIQDWLECPEYESKIVTRQTLPNEYYSHDRKDINAENAVEATFEFKFGRDLIRFILDEYLTYLYWFPTGIFAETDLDSPFTLEFKEAFNEMLNSTSKNLQEKYDNYFEDKSKVVKTYEGYIGDFKDNFVNGIFSPNAFLEFCAFLGISAGLSYYYGSYLAPILTLQTLITAVKEIKYLGKADDNIWNEVQDWLNRRESER